MSTVTRSTIYTYGKQTLAAGDLFRASSGPYYEADGAKLPMAEHGTFRFVAAVSRRGKVKYLEAVRVAPDCGTVVVWVGTRQRDKHIEKLVLRPHKITKVRTQASPRKRRRAVA